MHLQQKTLTPTIVRERAKRFGVGREQRIGFW
uniref:Uncharacterized protein n=1 Tax=Anopheles minimus TaxID=112268 RepID=A0A182WNV0_9DIPT